MGDGRDPIGLAMILCDAIHTDPATGKRTLLGLFSAVFGPEFPVTIGHMAVYTAITECVGKINVTLQIIDVNEEREPVIRVGGEVECDNPLTVLEIDMRIGGLSFPEPGEYRVQFYADDAPIIERRMIVAQTPNQEQSDE